MFVQGGGGGHRMHKIWGVFPDSTNSSKARVGIKNTIFFCVHVLNGSSLPVFQKGDLDNFGGDAVTSVILIQHW